MKDLLCKMYVNRGQQLCFAGSNGEEESDFFRRISVVLFSFRFLIESVFPLYFKFHIFFSFVMTDVASFLSKNEAVFRAILHC